MTGTEFKLMRQEAYDSDEDGAIDRAEGIFSRHVAGEGGVRAYQVVWLNTDGDILPAASSNIYHAGKIVGMAITAGEEGDIALVQKAGEVTNVSWDLDPGVIYYLWDGGEISALEPRDGFSQKVGIGKDSMTLILDWGIPILLN